MSSEKKCFSVSLNFLNPCVIKFDASVDKINAINLNVSMNRIVKAFLIYYKNEINFSSLFGITEIVCVSKPSSDTIICAS